MLPAAVFDLALVRPSRKVLDAAEAAFVEETRFGAFVWDNALPAEVFDFLLVSDARRADDAALAAFFPVTLVAMV